MIIVTLITNITMWCTYFITDTIVLIIIVKPFTQGTSLFLIFTSVLQKTNNIK